MIVPFTAGQTFWGFQVTKLGVGQKPIPWRKLSAGRLAAVIRQAAVNAEMQRKAVEFGGKIREGDGLITP